MDNAETPTSNFEDASNQVASPDINQPQVQQEEMPDLSGVANKVSEGAWEPGWYQAKVVEGYPTASGFQWITGDSASRDGSSRNLLVCFRVKNAAGEERHVNNAPGLNYRIADLTAQKMAAVTELRKKYAGQPRSFKWPEKDLHRTSIAMGQIGQFERAFAGKTRLKKTEQGNLATVNLVGYDMDIRLTVNEDKFNEVAEFAQLGEKTTPKGKK